LGVALEEHSEKGGRTRSGHVGDVRYLRSAEKKGKEIGEGRKDDLNGAANWTAEQEDQSSALYTAIVFRSPRQLTV
jgi:hypothetical protein